MDERRFVVSRKGLVHDYHCLSLTSDGDCDCERPLKKVRGRRRNRSRDLTADEVEQIAKS